MGLEASERSEQNTLADKRLNQYSCARVYSVLRLRALSLQFFADKRQHNPIHYSLYAVPYKDSERRASWPRGWKLVLLVYTLYLYALYSALSSKQ